MSETEKAFERPTGILVLASGASRRLGSPKQLLPCFGTTLLRRAAEAATRAGIGPVIVVLPPRQDEMLRQLDGLIVESCENPGWKSGMSSSIRAGLDLLCREHPECEAVLLMVCDQPFATADLLRRMHRTCVSSGLPIAACEYAGVSGVPAMFAREFFPALNELREDQGARSILRASPDKVARIPFPEGEIDIDTPEQYRALLARAQGKVFWD